MRSHRPRHIHGLAHAASKHEDPGVLGFAPALLTRYVALGKSLPLSGTLFPQLPDMTVTGVGKLSLSSGRSLSFCLSQILWATSVQGGAVAAGLGRDNALRVSVWGEG